MHRAPRVNDERRAVPAPGGHGDVAPSIPEAQRFGETIAKYVRPRVPRGNHRRVTVRDPGDTQDRADGRVRFQGYRIAHDAVGETPGLRPQSGSLKDHVRAHAE